MSMGWISRLGVTAVVAGGVAFGLSGVAAITAPDGGADTAHEARVLTVATMKARLVPGYEVRRNFTGRVEARRESQVGFELGGLVTALLAEEGDHLEVGQVIARLDTARLEVQLKQLRGRRAEVQANIGLARATRIRQERLAKKGYSSQQRYDEARFGEQVLFGRLQQVDAEIASVELDIEKSEIKAPFAAIVGERFADEGIVIAAGAPVFDLLERTNPEARIGVAGDAVDGIAAGQQYALLVRGRRVPATVRSVLPVRDRGTRTVDVLLTLHAPLNGIRHGDLARLEIARRLDQPGFWLPLTALTESSRGLWAVYVAVGLIGDKSVLERRELEVLHQEADRVFVRGTLGDSEHVVVVGLHRLVPGQRVRITGAEDLLAAATRE
ncbi:MAG: efflux RND transporter periplasmic adaptor subunit [Planctomycetota bacterium]|nr:efflux RND transporter periplasmic adaptor subunit [Planctomycetota bacterium]